MAKKTAAATPKKTPTDKVLVKPNEYTLVFTADEMLSAINILSFSEDIFKQMSINLVKEGDVKAGDVFSARAILSHMIYSRFRDAAEIGEPSSREVH